MSAPTHAGDIAGNLELVPAVHHAPAKAVMIDPVTKKVVDDLFDRLKGIFTGWRATWPTEAEENQSKREWVAEFMRGGIRSMEQIQAGIRTAAKQRKEYVPQVGVFIGWCFAPEVFGLPPLERAYAQAMRNIHPSQAGFARWSHPAIYHAAVASGFYTLSRLERSLGMKRFAEKYEDQCRRLARGEVLPPAPVAALPAPAGPRTPEVGNAALAEIRNRLGGRRG
ncbi:replication P family protein [Metapseudomonas lalkuanensis]|uniref:replication protein P n=1 Tax=Metapseudomonas lalkuanensis TaxID=2604832 RepID=UPI001CF347A7|nr:replication protein P [Pseudomonas lalkuanensis]UCP00082.1 replication P family protein [Pseudomonas lalkuanensis]